MRLHILSDLHLEFEPFAPPAVEADVVILAGDVSTGRNGLKWALKTFPDRPVIYVLGNHEFYGQKLQKLIKELQELADGTNIHLLENGSCSNGDVVFLGATLWTDFALNGNPVVSEVTAQTSMNDYRRIRTLPRYSRLKPSDTRRLHMESRRWLEDQAFAHRGSEGGRGHTPCTEQRIHSTGIRWGSLQSCLRIGYAPLHCRKRGSIVGPWPYPLLLRLHAGQNTCAEIGRASCRERV